MAATKFAEFLTSKKIDPRRVVAASKELESLRPEDRQIRLAKRVIRNTEGGDKTKETRKPRSGRPVTARALHAALTGVEKISGPTKTRLLKAVNHVLEVKKLEKAELKTLF